MIPGTLVIRAASIDLVLQTPEETLAKIEQLPAADRAEVSLHWLERVRRTQPGDPWSLGFTVVERSSGTAVGGCAFKGPPTADGIVEIAYGIAAHYRGRGYATQAAAALTAFAFASGRVQRVRAHTRADNIASSRVLSKCGFRFTGEVIEPEDGPVGRWEKSAE